MITKENLAIVNLSSKDNMRENLMQVKIKDGKMTATNGHYLGQIKVETNGLDVLVDAQTLKMARKSMKKEDFASIEGSKLTAGQFSYLLTPSKLQFPDTDIIIKDKKEVKAHTYFNPILMEEICKTARQAGIRVLKVELSSPMDAIRMTDKDNATFVLMPMKGE